MDRRYKEHKSSILVMKFLAMGYCTNGDFMTVIKESRLCKNNFGYGFLQLKLSHNGTGKL